MGEGALLWGSGRTHGGWFGARGERGRGEQLRGPEEAAASARPAGFLSFTGYAYCVPLLRRGARSEAAENTGPERERRRQQPVPARPPCPGPAVLHPVTSILAAGSASGGLAATVLCPVSWPAGRIRGLEVRSAGTEPGEPAGA